MNTNIVQHFLSKNFDLILKKSLINCHVHGVDSILFDDTPEARVRMFVAQTHHELWRNDFFGKLPMTTAFHTHHCDVVLEAVTGYTFSNILVSRKESKSDEQCFVRKFNAFEYQSQISAGACRFISKGISPLVFVKQQEIATSIALKASDLHSIFVEQGKFTAWVVYEGKEDKRYDPTCFTNANLSDFDASNLYKPMNKGYLERLLDDVFSR
jgi:hypothetical protein